MKLSARQIAQVWFDALIESKPRAWPDISKRLLQYLYTRGELRRVKGITRAMEQLQHEHQKTIGVTVRMATALPEATIHTSVKQVLPTVQPVFTIVQDPAVLGGVQIETTNQRFNLSLHGQLRQLTNALTN